VLFSSVVSINVSSSVTATLCVKLPGVCVDEMGVKLVGLVTSMIRRLPLLIWAR
jgi:hypothetical protein